MKTSSPRFFLWLIGLVCATLLSSHPAFAQEPNWILKAPANSPTGRYLSGMAYDVTRGEVVLFGGRDSNNRNDTWVWDGTTWTQKNPVNSPPPRQVSNAMAYDLAREEVVLFGGYAGNGVILNDTWVWDGVNWTQKHPANSPTPRNSSSMAYDADRGEVVLFGGTGGSNDTWVWDGVNWTQKSPLNSPAPNYDHAMAYDSARMEMVLFGGNSSPNDTWVWDGVNWAQKFPLNSPPPREYPEMAYDADRGQVVLFAGVYAGSLNDTWVWDGTNWTQMSPLKSPTPRHLHAMAYDEVHGQVVLFGGSPSLPSVLGDTWVFSVAPAFAFPPQKIFLAFGQPSSFSIATLTERPWISDHINFTIPIPNLLGSRRAAVISDSYRSNVTSSLKNIFTRSGVRNIEWTTSDSSDALIVYFCPTLTPDRLYGYSLHPPDRYNFDRRGKLIVFVQELSPDESQDAKTAAHEIGHLLGLRHVKPIAAVDPSNQEVMIDSDSNGSDPQFFNAVSGITDPWTLLAPFEPRKHNPLYHLLRYVDGWSTTQLQNAGISPGSWDTGFFSSTRFYFENSNLRLHNIMVFVSGGETETTLMVEQIPSATLAELSEYTFTVPQGQGIFLLASSTTNGPIDVISSTGDPFVSTNNFISADVATNAFALFREESPTNAVIISTATAESDLQSPYCNISMSAPTILRLDFRGTLQSSTNLTDWADASTNLTSPHFIVVGPNDGIGFFRSRQ